MMGAVKQLYMDALEAAAERYMAEHPDADPADAFEAADPNSAFHDMGDAQADHYNQEQSK